MLPTSNATTTGEGERQAVKAWLGPESLVEALRAIGLPA